MLTGILRRVVHHVRRTELWRLPAALERSAKFRLARRIDAFYRERLYTNSFLAKLFPFRAPPILLLSYPRSGSSWIGKILSFSPDLAYLREPIHQSFQQRFKVPALLEPRPERSILRCHMHADPGMLEHYLECARRAFEGLVPQRPNEVLNNDRDFRFLARRHKTLLIKEINPLMTEILVRRHSPRIVVILRHPAAVAFSFEKMGWLLEEDLEEFGYLYGRHLGEAIQSAPHALVVRYEDFAHDPEARFRELFQTLGSRLPADFQQIVDEFCTNPARTEHPYEIRRSSRFEADKWRLGFPQHKIEAVMRGYRRSLLPYYRQTD